MRESGTREPDQAVMQRGAQWNKPLYKPEYWAKVRDLDFSKADVDPAYGCGKPVVMALRLSLTATRNTSRLHAPTFANRDSRVGSNRLNSSLQCSTSQRLRL